MCTSSLTLNSVDLQAGHNLHPVSKCDNQGYSSLNALIRAFVTDFYEKKKIIPQLQLATFLKNR